MRNIFSTRRRKLVALGLISAAVAAGGALAYFVGFGTASQSVHGGSAPGLTVTIDPIGYDLYPGEPVPVSGTVANNSGHSARVGQLVADSPLITGEPVGCNASWFAFPAVPLNTTLADLSSVPWNGTLELTETGTDQSACEGASLTVHIKSGP